MRRLGHLLPVAALTALLGCAGPPPAAPPPLAPAATRVVLPSPISAVALRAIYAVPHREEGTVLLGAHRGAKWTKWTKPDGGLELLAGHGMFADSGKFVIRGNMICSTWGIIDSGRENCVHLVQVADDEYVSYGADGLEGSRFKIMPPGPGPGP
jgi:hypothetical protein